MGKQRRKSSLIAFTFKMYFNIFLFPVIKNLEANSMPSKICEQLLAVCCVLLPFFLIVCRAQQDYQIGVGIADITGPAAETSMV